MEIVPMTQGHLPQVLLIESASFADPWSPAAFLAELGSPIARYFVAMEGETVLGYGGMQRVLDESYVTNIAVLPHHRGQGVGRALLAALIGAAKVGDGALITLEVRPSNAPALALYESLGFLEVGRRRNFYEHPTEDALLLTRTFEEETV